MVVVVVEGTRRGGEGGAVMSCTGGHRRGQRRTGKERGDASVMGRGGYS